MDDEVVFFGRQGTAEISQAELETVAGTIGAEIYTIFGTSMPKVLKA
jgi:alanine racemase